MGRFSCSIASLLFVMAILPADQPSEAWVRRYNGPANGSDIIAGLQVDNTGTVHVVGTSRGATTGYDYATIQYDSAGNETWVRRYDGPGSGGDQGRSLAVDDSGNVYVTGAAWTGSTFTDYGTVKYDARGVRQWVALFDGPTHWYDLPNAVIVDESGNVYVTGITAESDSNGDFTTIKYNPAGIEQWVRRYHGPAVSSDEGYCLALARGGSGNIYVGGRSGGTGGLYDYLTIRYTPDGDQQWIARYDGPGRGWDHVRAIAVDRSGNVYVTGSSENPDATYDYATVKYDSTGRVRWVRRYDGPAGGSDIATSLALDHAGNVVVAGYSAEADSTYHFATVKYTPDGTVAWIRRFGGPDQGSSLALSVAIDDSDNIYVAGSREISDGSAEFAIVMYDTGGAELWSGRYQGPGKGRDGASCLALGPAGDIYVAGQSFGIGTGFDYATVKYTRNLMVAEGNTRPPPVFLEPIQPNPAWAPVEIRFSAPVAVQAAIKIYDASGMLVRCFYSTINRSPCTNILWNGRDGSGHSVPEGVYFIRFVSGTQSVTEKVVLLR